MLGPRGLFIFAGAVSLGYVAFGLYRLTRRGRVMQSLEQAFVHLPRSTHAAYQLRRNRPESDQRQAPG